MKIASWALAILLVALNVPAQADDFPNKTIRLVVPYGPGGTTDLIAREIAKKFHDKFGVNALVENKPGGSATVGTAMVARATPDGYTLLVAGSPHSINNTLRKDVPYDAVKDFEPVALIFKLPHVIAVHPSVPVTSMKEFYELAVKKPDALSCGGSPASSSSLATELLSTITNAPVNIIIYNGDAATIRDLLPGHINCFNGIANQVLPSAQGGKLRILATTGTERLKALPDVPTIIELGIKEYEVGSWNGVFAPAGTPKSIVDKLAHAVIELGKDPAFAKKWEDLGAQVSPGGPDVLRKHLADEIARWKPVIENSKLQPK